MKIVFFGSSPFSARVLQYLHDHNVNIAAVVTQPPKPKGRSKEPAPTSVAELAKTLNIPLHEPEKASSSESLEVLKSFQADLFVVVAYGQILKQALLDIPPKGCINVHPSLLPKYRGAAPIQRCMMHGDKETGVTIMHVVLKLDAGDIILQEKITIDPNATFPELESQLCDLSCPLLLRVIQGEGESVPQNDDETTYADKIEPSDCELHWDRPAQDLHNLVRAVTPRPGAWCRVEVRGKEMRLKVLRSELTNEEGPLIINGLKLLEVQLEGKRPMSADEFLRGIGPDEFLIL